LKRGRLARIVRPDQDHRRPQLDLDVVEPLEISNYQFGNHRLKPIPLRLSFFNQKQFIPAIPRSSITIHRAVRAARCFHTLSANTLRSSHFNFNKRRQLFIHAQRNAFRRSDARLQSRSFARWNQSLTHSPNSYRLS
jgi:hypothetical protein